jgi:hypothetical protein
MGQAERFLVDTGCIGNDSGDVGAVLFDKLLANGMIQPAGHCYTETLTRTTNEQQGRVGETSVVGLARPQLLLKKSKLNVLGLNYWSRFVVTFDFPAGVMYLKKSSRFDQPDLQDLSGLHLLRRHGRMVVHSVEEGSPAALAGLKSRDEILTVDGTKAEDVSLFHLRQTLCVEGANVAFLASRGGKQREVHFTLRDWQQNTATTAETNPERPGWIGRLFRAMDVIAP